MLITFSFIMLDSQRLLLLLSTWYFFCLMGRGDHPGTFLLKALFCLKESEIEFIHFFVVAKFMMCICVLGYPRK